MCVGYCFKLCDITGASYYHLYCEFVFFKLYVITAVVDSFVLFSSYCFKLCDITAIGEFYLYFMDDWLKFRESTAVSGYHLYSAWIFV